MHCYSKAEKRLIRDYAARAYEAELEQALGKLEQQFGAWRGGQISADELSEGISNFTRGPLHELRQRYSANLDDVQVAHAIVTGLLPRDGLPAELLAALQRVIAFYEVQGASAGEDSE